MRKGQDKKGDEEMKRRREEGPPGPRKAWHSAAQAGFSSRQVTFETTTASLTYKVYQFTRLFIRHNKVIIDTIITCTHYNQTIVPTRWTSSFIYRLINVSPRLPESQSVPQSTNTIEQHYKLVDLNIVCF
jgi:hypothetical protein